MSWITSLEEELELSRREGTYKESQYLQAPMAPETRMEGKGDVLVLSSNNYLGLSNHPDVVKAGREALEKYGAGTASVRFICGTFEIHRELEQTLAKFLKKEAALSYVSCWAANTGLLPSIVKENDLLISDELKHASIIDACRMTGKKVRRQVFRHSDMKHLEEVIKANEGEGNVFIVSDGVFSMEGDICNLPDLVDISRKYKAALILDDSHGTGVLGERGAGVAEHFGLEEDVDIITSTLGKALGGAAGGFVAAKGCVIDYLYQKSRPMLFSNALPPTVAASSKRAIEVLLDDSGRVETLKKNTDYFRSQLKEMGFQPLDGESAIIPIIVGETAKAIEISKRLLEKKIFVTGFGFPVVPEGTARIRIQMSAALTKEQLDRALKVLGELKEEMGL